jgi:hypothetical protein
MVRPKSLNYQMAQRAAKQEKSGKKCAGRPPEPPQAGPKASDQINLTDEESRIMPMIATLQAQPATPTQAHSRQASGCDGRKS